ncbi:RES domain-containing protein [Labilibaculum sp.]|uniref:RES domain-containing protein n=1 Tax=Labilibaculum sp. TaxID=2060723 RepID=UPI002AA6C82C|nr:RES domain-containing protein [Labilibaculum sp.]
MIFNLPKIPDSKKYKGEMTTEQKAILKCIAEVELSEDEKTTLQESIEFYKSVFPKLKGIDLSIITDEQVIELKEYIKVVFNFFMTISNDIHFDFLFRVSIIKDDFIEKRKVRNPKFLGFPPLELVKRQNVYNRANSPDRTVLYASFYENVALRETKPQVGERIIISTWQNITGNPFNSYPISNSSVINEGVEKATNAFKNTMKVNHPLFAEIMDLVLGFLASEFVKDDEIQSNHKYEYLYSAFFSDQILSPRNINDPTPYTDFIIYPSIAWKHEHENVAVVSKTAKEKLKLIKAVEYEIEETYYEYNLKKDQMPVKLKFIRAADWIEEDMIIWEDE